ncbi:nuclear mRNA export, poly(A)+RNA binding protein, partial [Quaeritorhiza haematococci]
SPYGRGQPGSASASAGPIEVSIMNWQGGDENSLIEFLRRKVESPVNISNIRYHHNKCYVTVDNHYQAETLVKLSGIRFAGGKLSLRTMQPQSATGPGVGASVPSPSGSTGGSAIQALTTLIQSRYNPAQRFLNLENIDADPILISAGVDAFGKDYKASKVGQVICKLISEICPDVQTISFANNKLRSLLPLSTLAERVPGIVNLSFQDNQLSSYSDIEPVNGRVLTNLREVVFTGNPVREKELSRSGSDLRYRSDLKKIFPSIQILDTVPVVQELKFDIPTTNAGGSQLPLPVQGGFFDSHQTAAAVSDFMQRFFTLFDTNRTALLDLYEPTNSSFSLAVNPQSPPHARSQSRRRDEQDTWWGLNRNLARILYADKRIQNFFMGNADIVRVFNQMPRTQHGFLSEGPGTPAASRTVIVDAYQTGGPPNVFLHLVVHGEFLEVNLNLKRSFDRTFVIIPAPPNSKAMLAGYQYCIINDQLIIRSHNSRPGWAEPQQQSQQAPAPGMPLINAAPPAVHTPPPSVHHLQQPHIAAGGGSPLMGGAAGAPAVAGAGQIIAQQLPDVNTLLQLKVRNGLACFRPIALQENFFKFKPCFPLCSSSLPFPVLILHLLSTLPTQNDIQHQQLIQFAQSTGLNYQFTLQCLTETGWDSNRAMAAFESAKAHIPPMAFTLQPI